MSHQIAPTLVKMAVPIGDVQPHDENYRHGDVDAIRASLTRFGQVKPIVVQASTMKIVAGNHTYAAAVAEEWTHIAATVVDLTDAEARAYLVADNRTSDLAENDDEALAAILGDLDGSLAGTGYEDGDLAALLAAGDTTPAPTPEASDPRERTNAAGPLNQREIVMVLTVEQANEFGRQIKRLQEHYDTTGTSATVLAIIADSVRRANAVGGSA